MDITLPIITQIILATNDIEMREPRLRNEARPSSPPDDDNDTPIREPPPVSGPVDLAVFGKWIHDSIPQEILNECVIELRADAFQMMGEHINILLDNLSVVDIEMRFEVPAEDIVREFAHDDRYLYNPLLLLIVAFLALACRMRVVARYLMDNRRFREGQQCESVVTTFKGVASVMLLARDIVKASMRDNMGAEDAEVFFKEELKTVHKHLWAVGRFWPVLSNTYADVLIG
ncbi:hypothetical protein B0T22DRAFT_275196 [Podospora appendiculata]|uniref:Uncharacterized protein n=1 Tax=Podospora appendiculata TaxID=314037 RepID=A0AAE1C7Q8_9PEZI|nr:hypothetical protein B0T22DRAFT_275196 [Podospora appendiculata]